MTSEYRHLVVYSEPGRCGGWPANNGSWHWGDEILVGFDSAEYAQRPGGMHQVKYVGRQVVQRPGLLRSLDGGETWEVEYPECFACPPKEAKQLTEPMDFTTDGFAMTLRKSQSSGGTSRFFHSVDRGRNWFGPFMLPLFGETGIMARTDYLVSGKRDCLAFITAAKENGREGYVICIETHDGGLTWQTDGVVVASMGLDDGFAIMPSSIRLPDEEMLVAVRIHEPAKWKRLPRNYISVYAKEDDGVWGIVCPWAANTGWKSGNPPHLIRLADGRLCITYGYRADPYGIRAVFSHDDGSTWTTPLEIRGGGACFDLGYPRTVQRPDGKLVTVYYWCPTEFGERTIEATIWEV